MQNIYSYLNPTLERYDLENNNKWLAESQQTLNDVSGIYHPGDTVTVSTDFVIWTRILLIKLKLYRIKKIAVL